MTPWTLALLLVLCPPVDNDPDVLPEPLPSCPIAFQALKDVAHLLEIYDRAGNWGEYGADVRWCQRGFRRAWGTPPLSQSERLPPYQACLDRTRFAAAHVEWLEHQQLLYPYRDWSEWLREARERAHWWSLAARARTPGDFAGRRVTLAELRDALGVDAWHVGDWPAPVPLHFYRR